MTTETNKNATNPLLVTTGLPRFDEIEPEHIVPGVTAVLENAERQVAGLEAALQNGAEPTWENTIEALDDIEKPFEYSWGPVGHLFGVKNSPELRKAYEAVLPKVVNFSLRVKQSQPIDDALRALRDGAHWEHLSATRKRIIEKKLLSTELAGIALEGQERDRFNELVQELSRLSTEFSNHVLDATKAYSLIITDPHDAEGLPPSLLQLASHSYNEARGNDEDVPADAETSTPEQGPWRITLDVPSFVPFIEHCGNRRLREQIYRAYVTRASEGDLDNTPVILRILRLRREQAALLGYENYADVSLAQKMAPSVPAIEEMFETLRTASWEPAKRDHADLEELAFAEGETEPLNRWDVPFWAERLREKRFEFTEEQLRPYFPLERVLQGLFALVRRLFGVRVESSDGEAPRWHEDVRFFKVFDDVAGEHIASFYLDPYSRPEDKRSGAWMNDCLTRRRVGGELQIPVAHLVCNSTPPVAERPSLMTFREVETLFHEFGHGLQHMLTTVDEPDAAGINGVEWDAVELPSQFMENWCYHKPTLLGLSAHYETGEPLPDELFEKIQAARNFRAGPQMLRQLLFGMTDMQLHTTYDPDGAETPFELQRRINEKTSVLPMLPEDRSLCAFQHIFAGGYAAGYYSYKWAEVLSADAFAAFEEAGLHDEQAVAETGRRFRETILSQGGSRDPMEVFQSFRGREPNPHALLKQCGLL